MKIIKKRFLVFILCFTLFTCGFVHTDPVKEVKAAAFTLPVAIGFFGICLNMLGVTYYKNGQGSLNGDLADFATSKNVSINSLLGPFGNVVVDVGRKVAKFSAAQIYLCKEFISYLKNKNEISISNKPTFNENIFTVGGLTSCFRINDGDVFRFYYPPNSDGMSTPMRVVLLDDIYVFCVFAFYDNSYGSLYVKPYFFTTDSNYNAFRLQYYSGGSWHNLSMNYDGGYVRYRTMGSQLYTVKDELSSMIGSFPVVINDNTYTFYNTANASLSVLDGLIRERFKISDISDTDSNTLAGNVNLTDYYYKDATVANDGSISNNVGDEVDDTKPAVIYIPQIIDKAVQNAKNRDSNATVVTENDLLSAIDDTAVGVINPEATDEEDRVIAPPLDLDISEDLTQDDAVIDTIVEDLGIPEPPPEPPPVDPPIIDSALASKFPFSIFADFILIMSIFDEEPEAPVFNLGFTALGRDFEFTIDLSAFNSVASVVRTMELLAFIVGIIFVTIKFMQGGSD